MLKPEDVSQIGNVDSAYIFYVQLSADAAHPSVEALSRHIATASDDDQRIQSIIAEPIPTREEIEDTLNLACVAMHDACGRVNQILGGTRGGEHFDALTDEYKRLINRKR